MNPTIDLIPEVVAPPATAAPRGTPEFDPALRERVRKLRIGGPGDATPNAKGSLVGRIAWLPWLLCAALALTWGAVAIRTYRPAPVGTFGLTANSGGSATTSASAANTAAEGSGTKATAAPGAVQLEVKGYLTLSKIVNVSPIDVGGRVVELRGPAGVPNSTFAEGAMYKKGDVIAVLDSTNYQAQLDESKASLIVAQKATLASRQRLEEQLPKSVRKIEKDQLQAEIDETKATLERADQELSRQENLRSASVIKELQQAVADRAGARARLDRLNATMVILQEGPRIERVRGLEADVAQAVANEDVEKARLAQAEWRVFNCTILAPITGTVLSKKAEVGNLANPMAFSGGGGICDLGDLADMEIECDIAERDIGKLTVGMPCRIRADAYQDRSYEGNLDRIYPTATRSNNTIKVRCKVRLPDGETPGLYLKPDMNGVVTFYAPGKAAQ